MRINFSFTTPANPFTPGRLVIKSCIWSSGTCYKLCSPCRNSFWGQTLPETVQAASLRVLLTTRGCSWSWGLTKILFNWGRSGGSVTDNSLTWLYQGCAGQLGVIRVASTSSVMSFAPDVSNSVGMHLLLGCVDLLSTTGKMVSDGILLIQKDPTLRIPTLHKCLGILLEIVAIRLGLGNFWKLNLPWRSIYPVGTLQ